MPHQGGFPSDAHTTGDRFSPFEYVSEGGSYYDRLRGAGFSVSYLPDCPLQGIAQGLAKENTAAKRG